MRRLAILLALPIFGLAAESDVAAGKARFRIYCSECHGREGRGGRGPDLTSGRWTHGGSDADLAHTIAKGVPGTAMPAYGEDFDENDIKQLVAFIRSLAAGAGTVQVTGNPARGFELFWTKGMCGASHMVSGLGGRLGPELTRAGAQRSLAYLKESILQPSADLTPGYQAVSVVTRGGRHHT